MKGHILFRGDIIKNFYKIGWHLKKIFSKSFAKKAETCIEAPSGSTDESLFIS